MPQSCVALGCTNRHTKGTTLQFFSFPLKNESKLKKWLNAVQRGNWTPTKYSRICSDHFNPNDYLGPGMNVPYLKEDAVPSIFKAFPGHLQKQSPKPRLRKKRIMKVEVEVSLSEGQPNIELGVDSKAFTSKRIKLEPSPMPTA